MTAPRRYRRRRPRAYVRFHIGCLGCSIPILAALGVLAVLAVLLP